MATKKRKGDGCFMLVLTSEDVRTVTKDELKAKLVKAAQEAKK
jgi:hypothetical protein